jgi:uncharacterized protein with HEPN domain
MQPKVLKYLLDIESVINEIELIKTKCNNSFYVFQSDIILQRAVERDLEIIGEAIRKLIELNPELIITSSKNIIGLRNIISHAYDSVEPEMIWGIIQNNIPLLAAEINKIKSGT